MTDRAIYLIINKVFSARKKTLNALLTGAMFLSAFLPGSGGHSGRDNVLGSDTLSYPDYASHKVEKTVDSSFFEKDIKETEIIPYTTQYKDDAESEYGLETLLQEGADGQRTYTYKVTYWLGEEIYRNLINTEEVPETPRIISVGKKVIWREIDTEYGKIKYWRKIHVWATKYDGNCLGCRGLTYSGTLVRKGVCAVDPKVIPLGTNFYVEGYGMCRSEDIGGAIKGNKVDLGYEDASKSPWGAAYTNVYLITSYPTD